MAATPVLRRLGRTPPVAWRTIPARTRWSAGVFLVAAAAMIVIYHQLWADPTGRLLGSRNHGNDPMQMMWFLKWVPWSIVHGHNPVATNAIFYPHGIALTWNTFVPTLGILAAPVTMTLGAAVSFAVLMTLGPALTAVTGFWWLRRHTSHPLPAVVGGFVIAFSPFVAGHLLGHLNLVFLPLIPIIVMLLEDLLWRAPRSTRRTIGYLAVATAAQIGISEEMLLILAVAVLIAVVVAAAVMPRDAIRCVRRAAAPVLTAAGICVLLASPLLVSQLLLSTPLQMRSQRFHAVAGDYVNSLTQQIVTTADGHRSFLGGAEDGVYLGWPLLVLIIGATVLTWRRDRPVRVAVVTGLVTVSLTFGSTGPGHTWLPWHLLEHIPDFSAVLPARFAMATSLVLGWLLSRWIDAALQRARGTTGVDAAGRRVLAGVVLAALAMVPIVSFAPRSIGTSAAPPHVAFFGSAAERRLLAPGAPILLLPIAWPGDARAMYYQQLDNFRFRQPGGYGLTSYTRSITDTETLRRLAGSPDRPGPRGAQHGGRPPTLADGRAVLRRIHPAAIVVVLDAPDAGGLLTLAGELTGRPADLTTGGVAVWLLSTHGRALPTHLLPGVRSVHIA